MVSYACTAGGEPRENFAQPVSHIDVAAAALRDVRRAQPTFRLLGLQKNFPPSKTSIASTTWKRSGAGLGLAARVRFDQASPASLSIQLSEAREEIANGPQRLQTQCSSPHAR